MNKLMAALTVSVLATCKASAQDCSQFLTNPIVTRTTVESSGAGQASFRLLQCAANWRSAQDVQSAGISAEIPVYGIPVPLSLNWDQNKVEQWKSENCSAEERRSASEFRYFQTVSAIDPLTARAALACYQEAFRAETSRAQRSALRCRVTDTPATIVFEAEWARTPGEEGPAPVVQSFSVQGTVCATASAVLPAGGSVPEGGAAVLCAPPQGAAAAFSLNTSRGSCVEVSQTRYPRIILPQLMVLTQPTFISGTDVELPAGFQAVTNGYPLTLRAERLAIGSGSSIRSFEAIAPQPLRQGRPAQAITLTSAREAPSFRAGSELRL